MSSFFEELAPLHETQRLEFKEAGARLPEDLWETYSAFANTEGGTIVLGVREDTSTKAFTPVGVANAQDLLAAFWSNLRNPQRVERDIMLLDGAYVLSEDGLDFVIIEVPRAERGEKPVRVYDRHAKEFIAYIRRGEGDFHATEDDIRLMFYDGIPGADRKALDNFGLEALCQETITRYRNVFTANKPQSPWNEDSTEDFLYHIGATAKGYDGKFHPTQAGLLAFGYEFEITNYSPHFLLDYREETSGNLRWADRIVSQSGDWSGNLIDFYFMVTERLLRYFKQPFSTNESGTIHGSQNVITEATNEALANAIVHAYYRASGSVRIVLQPDHLVIANPGSLLIDKDVAIAGGYSEARNPALMRIFSFIGVSDRAGSGLQRIWSVWESSYGRLPILSESHAPASVSITLPILPEPLSHSESSPKRILHDDELLAILAESENGLTPSEVHDLLGVSMRSAQARLRALFASNTIARQRDGHSFRYFL